MATADDRIAGEIGAAVMMVHRQIDAIDRVQKQLLASYELLAQCIRSDQVPDAVKVLEADPAFAAWYKAKFPSAAKSA